jgi:putative transposase
MCDKYTHKKGIVYLNQYHVIFCPKYRRKVLVGEIANDLKDIFYNVAKERDFEIKALEIMPDHVHLFISLDPRLPLHETIRYLKWRSSRILREKYPKLKIRIPSLWTRSYFCCSVGNISDEAVKRYIEEQKNA